MTRARALGALALLVPLALLAAPRFVFHGGIIHFEARKFLLHFTSDRSFLSKVFDPNENDLGDHRGRELSSVVDDVDAHWVDATIRSGEPSFLPISWLAGSTAIVCLVLAKRRRLFPRVSPGTTCLLLGLFLASPVVFLNARTYIRSAKMDAAVLLSWLVFTAWDWFTRCRSEVSPGRVGLVGFLASLALSMTDEQGAFLGGVVALATFVSVLLESPRERPRLVKACVFLGAAGAGVVLSRMIYWWVSPAIIHSLNGYWPDHSYESGLDSPPLSLEIVRLAASWCADQVSFALGSLPHALALAVLGASVVVVACVRADGSRRRPALPVLGVAGIVLGCTLVMLTLMIQRHSAVAQEDVRRGYYGLPVLVLGLFGGLVALERAGLALGRWRWGLDGVLLALVLCGVIALPNHERVSVSNHARMAAADSPILLDILRSRSFKPVEPRFDRQTNLLLWHYASVLDARSSGGSARR